jgi:regulator of sigma E protease
VDFIFNIGIFILVLSWLVFFHELGHFLAAKACGIYCDRFSLGMPPRIFGMRLGETDYCIGALPIGGYVKMAGQEDVPMTEEEREKEFGDVPPERWYSTKPVWQRVIVIAAGPLMNVVLAVFMYGVVAAIQHEVPLYEVDSRIGQIEEGSPTLEAPMYAIVSEGAQVDRSKEPDTVGWRTGDRVISVDGAPIKNIIPDLAAQAALAGGEELAVVLERTASDGTSTRYKSYVTPKIMSEGERLARLGVAPFFAIKVNGVIEGSPAEEAGLKKGDEILRADGVPVDRYTLILTLADFEDDQSVELEVENQSGTRTVTMPTRAMGRFPDYLIYVPEDDGEEDEARPVVVGISPEQEEATGLKPKDIITEINGEPVTFAKLQELEHGKPGAVLAAKVLRPAIWHGLLRNESTFETDLKLDRVGSIGIEMVDKTVVAEVPPSQIVPEAIHSTQKAIGVTFKTLTSLVSGAVSPRELGGPVMIGQITSQAARRGIPWLVEMTAFISINLAIFNLLPLPVLDGGHLVFLAIEGIRRKPMSTRVMEWVQQAGLVFIIMLMLFVTFNDVHRWIANIIP